MGKFAFLGGAARSIKKEKDTELAIQQELEMMEAKQKMLAEIQRRNEKIAQGIDPTTGEAFTIYGDGTTQNAKLPSGYVDQLRAAQEAEAEERRLKQDKMTAETERARADVEYKGLAGQAAVRRAGASETSAAARAQADRSRAGYYDTKAKEGPKASTALKSLVDDIAATDPAAKIRAIAIKNSPLSDAEKEAKLLSLYEIAKQEALRKAQEDDE
jgi:hypothetical protein